MQEVKPKKAKENNCTKNASLLYDELVGIYKKYMIRLLKAKKNSGG